MRSIDLKPTDENIINTVLTNSMGRNDGVYNFVKMLNSQYGSISIAVDGKWGSGKTFFIKQCKLVLDCLNDENDSSEKRKILEVVTQGKTEKLSKISYKSVYFDAWKNDSDIDPIVSLSKSIATTTFNIKTKAKSIAFKAGEQLVKIAVEKIAKIDIGSLLDIFQTEENTEAEFKKELASLIPKDGRLVIFIDELDRCRPVYAVKLLERVQHFFDNEKITFVFAVNLYELKNTIQKLYGSNFNGDRYLDRFFDFVMSIPEPDLELYYQNMDDSMNINTNFPVYYKELETKFDFSARERSHFENRVNTAIYKTRSKRDSSFFPFNDSFEMVDLFVIPYLIALKMIDGHKYEDFISNEDGTDFIDFLSANRTYSNIKRTKDIIELKNKAQKFYESIFVEDNGYKKHISEVLSLVSNFSNYEDKDTKPTKK
ncbi:hypothetical protein JF76_05540 [Lactobacillus kullabergensis]|uniref:KAP NTPase domain-containing protein n=1 Tax=Lactobacillus kullabergensis TaxID=1218493 RepID=A0A0F4LGX3_9LACO|nr:P-loop NTPase fold protein [Lactobacillus kullabergensis]KJY57568.1 hypothetical protein JF76_05540 [Lactobacillus kullabergensis]